jgi:hypothetical protein
MNLSQDQIISLYYKIKSDVYNEIRNNQRLQIIAILGFITIYFSIISYLLNNTREVIIDFDQLIYEKSQLKSQIAEQNWPGRATDAKKLLTKLKNKLWTGDTPGLAEADFETWIRKTLSQNGIDVRRVQLTRGPVNNDLMFSDKEKNFGIQRIRAKVIAPLKEAGLIRFLKSTSEKNSWIIVEKLIIRSGRNDRIEMDLSAFYLPKGGIL